MKSKILLLTTLLINLNFCKSFSMEKEVKYYLINQSDSSCELFLSSHRELRKDHVDYWYSHSAYTKKIILPYNLGNLNYEFPIKYSQVNEFSIKLIIPPKSTAFIGNVYSITQFNYAEINCGKMKKTNEILHNPGRSILDNLFENIENKISLTRFFKID